MSEVNKSIADSIRTGQYFSDSRNWYFNKYVYPSVERTFLGFVCVCFVFLVVCMFIFISATSSEVLESTYTVDLKDTIKQEAKFVPLDDKIEPSIALNNYMLSYYVAARESYDFSDLDVQLIKMANLSTLTVFNQFRNYMSINNVNSPQFVYQKDNLRSINVTAVKYVSPSSAQVFFTATSTWVAYNQQNETQWVSLVNFAVSNLEDLLNKRSKQLDFVVTSYTSSKVSA